MDIIIRNIKKEDIPSVVDINIKGWQEAYKGIIDDDYLTNLNNEYSNRIARLEKYYMENGFIVAAVNNEIVGFCRYVFDNSFSKELENVDSELCAIYVKPGLKNKGIGTKMFNHVTNEFKKANKSNMVLWCFKDNEKAQKFYEKMGGKIIKEQDVEIGNKKYKECCFFYNL